MKTKASLFLICLLGALLSFPKAAPAQLFTYATNNGAITIVRYLNPNGGSTIIPDTVGGLPVTAIGPYAFAGCAGLAGIVISTNVTTIGDGAFVGCHLPNVLIPNNVTTIGDYAFKGCFTLTGITIGNPSGSSQLTSIGAYAFADCTGFNSTVFLPPTVASLGAYAFSGCYNLTGISLDANLTSIGAGAFNGCRSLNLNSGFLLIPNSVTNIGDYAFNGCFNLPGFTLGNSTVNSNLTSIGDYAFADCIKLNSGLLLPPNVTSLGAYAFSGCYNLTGITLDANLTSIGAGAFNGCHNLNINNGFLLIPNSVTNIGDYAFDGCFNLPGLTLGNPAASSRLTSIGDYAFADCIKLNGFLSLPPGVISIGAYTFSGCFNLTGLSLDANLASIGAGAFSDCHNLNSPFSIPNSVTSIGAYAFSGCYRMIGISIGSGVTSIGTGAFNGCSSIANSPGIAVLGGNPDYIGVGGALFNKTETTLIQCPAGFTGTFQLPFSVTNIAEGAFLGCSRLTAINVNNVIYTSGGGVVFKKNGAVLTLVQYPGGLNNATYTLSNNVTGIADNAFDSCYALTGLYFQGNPPAYGTNVFDNFNQTAVVYYLPGMVGWGATYDGLPAVQLSPQAQVASINNVAIQGNGFGFTINGSNNEVIVVEVSTNLADPNWQPIETDTLTGTTFNFSDSQWTNHSSSFYRFHSSP